MQFHGAIGDAQVAGDDLVALTLGKQRQDLVFTRRQFGKRAFLVRLDAIALDHACT